MSDQDKPFSTHHFVSKVTHEDLMQMREWKEILIVRRGILKGSKMYEFFDEELKRVVKFLTENSLD